MAQARQLRSSTIGVERSHQLIADNLTLSVASFIGGARADVESPKSDDPIVAILPVDSGETGNARRKREERWRGRELCEPIHGGLPPRLGRDNAATTSGQRRPSTGSSPPTDDSRGQGAPYVKYLLQGCHQLKDYGWKSADFASRRAGWSLRRIDPESCEIDGLFPPDWPECLLLNRAPTRSSLKSQRVFKPARARDRHSDSPPARFFSVTMGALAQSKLSTRMPIANPRLVAHSSFGLPDDAERRRAQAETPPHLVRQGFSPTLGNNPKPRR